MRRSHPGIVGWRNDNPRHFRPRGGGAPHYRPGRAYGHGDGPRFQPPGSRSLLGPNPYHNVQPNDHRQRTHSGGYRGNLHNSHPRYSDRGHQYPGNQPERQIFPSLLRMRHENSDFTDNQQVFFDNQCHMNNMGDIDDRQSARGPPIRETFEQRPSPWVNPPFNYEQRSPTKQFRHQDEHNKKPHVEYQGHRPPASDHYGGNHGSTMENSKTFSRSVDDTVNIVRERLLSKESQPSSDAPSSNNSVTSYSRLPTQSTYQQLPEEQPTKKKSHKTRNIKTNCDKIKNKIVHQLFKMDKEKIHKLMDNPNSSTKFEYAISSLITESQNSYNRHLRLVAEKSLGTSTEFVHNDNNTIYEDTFMKQMQSLLDPQDTVLLEDIKPMVLAELCKVLQLDDIEQRVEYEEPAYSYEEQSQCNQFPNEFYNEYSSVDDNDGYFEPKLYGQDKPQTPGFDRSRTPFENEDFGNHQEAKPLFERRKQRKSVDSNRNVTYSEKVENEKKSIDCRPNDTYRRSATPVPLFDPNADHLSDDEDPFAELDKQYHVAVDHNFIDNDYLSSPSTSSQPQLTPPIKETPKLHTPEKPIGTIKPQSALTIKPLIKSPSKIKQEIENQLQNIAKSPLRFMSPPYKSPESPPISKKAEIKHEVLDEIPFPRKPKEIIASKTTESVDQGLVPASNSAEVTPEKHNNSNSITKISTPSDSRKRSADLRPSHRKEKRKKSESSSSDSTTNKQILNKNIIINLNDCVKDCTSDKRDTPKSVFNLYFSKKKSNSKEPAKESKKVEFNEKGYSDKYVKRKEISSTTKKSKEKDHDSKKKSDTNISSHSMLSPTESSSITVQTPTKTEALVKLKPIDMFVEQAKKVSVPHQAPRNTAPVPANAPPPCPAPAPALRPEVKAKPIIISRKLTKRHVATQVIRKILLKEVQTEESKINSTRFCQTERKRHMTRGSQTDSVHFQSNIKSDPYERMKQIDMEIQTLLQEKFKLYNSLESQDSCSSTMQSLGMAVLNPIEANEPEGSLSEDNIVDDFANIPMEELENIALESVDIEQSQNVNIEESQDVDVEHDQDRGMEQRKDKYGKRELRQKTIERERKSSQSPANSKTSVRNRRNRKDPNISLIEQIITDDRPLEDIISLDDLEVSPQKKKLQKTQSKPKKKALKNQKEKTPKPVDYRVIYDIKECTVALKQEDLQKVMLNLKKRGLKAKSEEEPALEIPVELYCTETPIEIVSPDHSEPPAEIEDIATVSVEVVNDIPIDMLDVSEDIVIGDDLKCGEKETDSSNPDIILDNSQPLLEDANGAGADGEGECRMYDYSSDENLRKDSITVSGNGDAVLAVECVDNNFIAACLDGNVYYFSGDGQLLNTLRGSNLAVTCLAIVKEKQGTTIYTGSLDSRIRYFDLETGAEKGPECNVLSPIQTMDRAWGTIFVGTRTGFVLQFECKNNMLIPVSTVKFAEQSILAIRAMKEGPRKVLLVAARSEPVTVKDAQTGLLLRTLEGPKMTVYTLLFEDGKVFCGTSSHEIHVFEYASGSHVFSHLGGKGAVCLRARGGLIFAGCYDGCVYVYRDGGAAPLAQLRGPGLMLLSLAVHATKIIAGYKDRSLYIWKIPLSILQEMVL